MLSLANLLNSPDGIRFLESKGIYVSPPDFCQKLRPPLKKGLIDSLASERELLVWDAQQLYLDYSRSVLSKIQALHDLEHHFGPLTVFISECPFIFFGKSQIDVAANKLVTLKRQKGEKKIKFANIRDRFGTLTITYRQSTQSFLS